MLSHTDKEPFGNKLSIGVLGNLQVGKTTLSRLFTCNENTDTKDVFTCYLKVNIKVLLQSETPSVSNETINIIENQMVG
jgi:hypothetical protein